MSGDIVFSVETRDKKYFNTLDSNIFIGSSIEKCEKFILANLDYYGVESKNHKWAITTLIIDYDQYNDTMDTEELNTKRPGYTDWYYDSDGKKINDMSYT